jgi:hypothetical protein
MCRPQKEPLRPLSAEERDQLEHLSRSLTIVVATWHIRSRIS